MEKIKKYQAIAIDYHFIYIICPNKECKEHIHKYNSNLNIEDRNEILKSVCKVDYNKDVCIRVDQTTSRITLTYYPNKSITISKRKFMAQQREYEPDKVSKGKMKLRKGNFVFKFD